MKEISLIGSTGSIGRQVCAVVRRYPEKFTIKSMVANASAEAFLRQLEEFKPAYAALVNEDEAATVKRFFRKDGQIVLHPENEALTDMIYPAEQVSILGKVVGLMRNYRS